MALPSAVRRDVGVHSVARQKHSATLSPECLLAESTHRLHGHAGKPQGIRDAEPPNQLLHRANRRERPEQRIEYGPRDLLPLGDEPQPSGPIVRLKSG